MFEYSIHCLKGKMYEKMGTGLVLRRSQKSWTLLSYLVHQNTLHTATCSTLDELLAMNDIRMGKSANKACRIRKLLTVLEVTSGCSEAEIQAVEDLLQVQEEKRKRKKDAAAAQDEAEEDEEALKTFRESVFASCCVHC